MNRIPIMVLVAAALAIAGCGAGPSASGEPNPTAPLAFSGPTSIATPGAVATDTSEPSATAEPSSTVTAKPKATVTITPEPTEPPGLTLAVAFTSLKAVSAGSYATAAVKTAAGAACTIDVEYKSGPSTAAGLGPKTADGKGLVTWSWKVGAKTSPGSWPVTVSCSKGGVSGEVTADLKVT